MATILIVGDAVAPTGFSRVLRQIFEPMHSMHTLYHLATNYTGDPHDYPWQLYPAHLGGDRFGIARLPQLVEATQPDIVFALADIWVQAQYMEVLRPYVSQTQIMLYVPIDGEPAQPEMLAQLDGAHAIYTFSDYSRAVLTQAAEATKQRPQRVQLPAIEVAELGVRTDVFYPPAGDSPDRPAARRNLFGDIAGIEDWFIVLNANRNQPRKRLDITMKGFAMFAADKPAKRVRLFLHAGNVDLGWDIGRMAARLGIQDRLLLTTTDNEQPQITDEQLNMIYNACDVGLNTSVGESFGLVSLEHGATGAAQIVPAQTTPGQLWGEQAVQLEASYTATSQATLFEEPLIAPETVAVALEQVYADADYRAEMGSRARAFATAPRFDWRAISTQWRKRIDDWLAS
ncbi:MAG: glycosyltransferase family 4 protein [Chloroflexota bacterium]